MQLHAVVGGPDYVDAEAGMLAGMWRKRARSYTHLGFTTHTPG